MSCERHKSPFAVRDEMGNYIGFFINGTDESVGVVDMTALAGDFVPAVTAGDLTFRILFETEGVVVVELADGSEFTITAVQTGRYLGEWYPANIRRVIKTGTTATFSVGW